MALCLSSAGGGVSPPRTFCYRDEQKNGAINCSKKFVSAGTPKPALGTSALPGIPLNALYGFAYFTSLCRQQ
jgi:hypothetical protein